MNSAEPTLVIMAAGLGSRFGGLKQITPVDDDGHIIIDYSLYDAKKAGFKNIVCVINPANEKEFKSHFKNVDINYAHQTLDKLPPGFTVPDGRIKPWGTAHAILSACDKVNGPFSVINADDFYGYGSFKLVYDFLTHNTNEKQYAVIGYKIENTISESGAVTRGILNVQDNKLIHIEEMANIKREGAEIVCVKNNETIRLPEGTHVSMNMWGFKHSLFEEFRNRFEPFLVQNINENPLKCEFLLPKIIGDLLNEKKVEVEVLPSVEKWYGVTYAEDMPGVKSAIESMKANGIYPQKLWSN